MNIYDSLNNNNIFHYFHSIVQAITASCNMEKTMKLHNFASFIEVCVTQKKNLLIYSETVRLRLHKNSNLEQHCSFWYLHSPYAHRRWEIRKKIFQFPYNLISKLFALTSEVFSRLMLIFKSLWDSNGFSSDFSSWNFKNDE